ncbi:MAG: hypothetical protein AB1725_00605 [Armatimonadota bacterium]
MRRAWLGFGQAVAALAAVTVWGCSSPPPTRPASEPKTVGATLDEIHVFELTTGRPRSAWDSVTGSEGVFFTCLCPPCENVAVAVAAKSPRVALLVASEEKAKRLRSRLDEGVRVLADPEFRVGKSLNACFLPRAYLVDTQGRLVWKQEDHTTPLRDAWKRASAHLSKEVRK